MNDKRGRILCPGNEAYTEEQPTGDVRAPGDDSAIPRRARHHDEEWDEEIVREKRALGLSFPTEDYKVLIIVRFLYHLASCLC